MLCSLTGEAEGAADLDATGVGVDRPGNAKPPALKPLKPPLVSKLKASMSINDVGAGGMAAAGAGAVRGAVAGSTMGVGGLVMRIFWLSSKNRLSHGGVCSSVF